MRTSTRPLVQHTTYISSVQLAILLILPLYFYMNILHLPLCEKYYRTIGIADDTQNHPSTAVPAHFCYKRFFLTVIIII